MQRPATGPAIANTLVRNTLMAHSFVEETFL